MSSNFNNLQDMQPIENSGVAQTVTQDSPQETSMTYLVKRGNVYYFRARIPSAVQQYFPSVKKSAYNESMPQEAFVRSLHTKDFGTAKIRCGDLLGKLSSLTDYCLNEYIPEEDKTLKVLEVLYGGTAERAPKPQRQKELRLSDLISLYVSDNEHNWSPATRQKAQGNLWIITKFKGDIPLSQITRDFCRDYREWLKNLPMRCTEANFDTLIKNEKANKIDINTVYDKFTWLQFLVKFGFEEGKLPANFAAGLAAKPPAGVRISLTPDEIKKWSSAITFDKDRPDLFWVWLLGLFQGGRLNEWCQLYLSDIFQHEGTWCINHVANKPDKRVKNKEQRITPIHSKILELHFLEFVEHVNSQGHDRLFPHLEYSKNNGYGNSTGKALNKLLKAQCNTKKSYHCLRHSFATQLKYCHAQPLVVKELTGHKFTDITFGHYGEHFPVSILKEELEKLQYELDWQHIKSEADKILLL